MTVSADPRDLVREGIALELRVRPDRESVHVAPVGELDIATIERLRDEVDELIAAGFQRVVVDLRELVFIDCSGLALLCDLYECAQRHGWRLSLVQGPAAVRRLFELTESLDALPFASTKLGRQREA